MFQRFIRQPQNVWLRKALFQIHLWTGIGVGLYIFMISISGSAIVFRREIDKLAWTAPSVAVTGPRMSAEQLRAAARQTFPALEVGEVVFSRDPARAAEVYLRRGERWRERVFDPYTGQDLGGLVMEEPALLVWLISLHDDLLSDRTGRHVNGVGALLFTLMCLTGMVIWWPGKARWRNSLLLQRKVGWRRFNWQLHSVLGFWTCLLLLMWGISGLYLAFPEPFNTAADFLQPFEPGSTELRLVDSLLALLANLHFGRAWGVGVKWLYVVLGLIPAALFVTGAVMWWHRVLQPALKKPDMHKALQQTT